MKGENCSVCGVPAPFASFTSYSDGFSHLLCLKCVRRQTVHDGSLTFYTKKGQGGERNSGGERCSMCGERQAEEACCCVFPPPRLCGVCKLVHVGPTSDTMHEFLPLSQMHRIKSEEDLMQLKHDLVRGSIAEETLKSNLFTITECEEKVQARYQTLLESFEAYSHDQTSLLSHLKKSMQNALKSSLSEAKAKIMDWDHTDLTPISHLLVSYWQHQTLDLLELFRCKQREPDIELRELFGIRWESRVDSEGNIDQKFTQPRKNPPELPSGEDPLNPLWFQEVDGFLTANQGKPHCDPATLKLRFYQTHLQCLQAMDEAFLEVVKSGKTTDAEGEWVAMGVGILQKKVSDSLPDVYTKQLSKRLSEAYSTQSTLRSAQDRHSELKSVLSGLSEDIESQPSPPLRMKRGRGRPRKALGRGRGALHKYPKQATTTAAAGPARNSGYIRTEGSDSSSGESSE